MNKKLYRSRSDKMIAGICGGLAKYFEIDSAIVRIIFLLLFFFKGIGFLAYIILWFVVPQDPYDFQGVNYKSTTSTGGEENIEEAEIIEETEETDNKASEKPNSSSRVNSNTQNDTKKIAGIILVSLGGIFLISKIFPSISFDILFPLILVGIGLYLIFNSQKGGKDEAR